MGQEFVVGDVASGAAAGTAISPGLGTIIGAGLGLAGSIFGGGSRKPQYDDKYFQRSVKDAKAAGLHPLFALGGGGAPSSGFIAGQSETGSKLGDALKIASRAVPEYARVTAKNPLQAKLAMLQIQDAEINIRKSLIDEQMMRSELARTVQASYSTGQDREFEAPRLERQIETQTDKKIVQHPAHQRVDVIMPWGQRLTSGRSITAQEFEDLYGDVAGSFYGVVRLGVDITDSVVDRLIKSGAPKQVIAAARNAAQSYHSKTPRKAQPATTYPLMP